MDTPTTPTGPGTPIAPNTPNSTNIETSSPENVQQARRTTRLPEGLLSAMPALPNIERGASVSTPVDQGIEGVAQTQASQMDAISSLTANLDALSIPLLDDDAPTQVQQAETTRTPVDQGITGFDGGTIPARPSVSLSQDAINSLSLPSMDDDTPAQLPQPQLGGHVQAILQQQQQAEQQQQQENQPDDVTSPKSVMDFAKKDNDRGGR